jgi:hypothetical protein
MTNRTLIFLSTLTLGLPACSDSVPAPPAASETTGIEIAGIWDGNFGSSEIIDDESWSVDFGSDPSVSLVERYSNQENVAITENPDDADFDPSKFNRIVWTEIDGGSFYYCTTDFGLDSADAAAELDTEADASDPDNSGCGGFSWTKLTRR